MAKKFRALVFILVLIAIVCFLMFQSKNQSYQEPLGAQVGSGAVLHQITQVSSASVQTISTTPVRLVDDPGDNCALELVSVTGFRIFASESWANGPNYASDDGFEIRLDETSSGADLIASFSTGFTSGGSTATVTSPSFQTRFGLDVNASRSESFWLTASASFLTLDGDTYFKFDIGYRKICTQ